MYKPAVFSASGDPGSVTRLKVAASALIALPAVLLAVMALGEMFGGDLSGVQHIPEAGALLLLLAVGWRYPRVAGLLLVGVGVLVFAAWLALVLVRSEPGFIVAVLVGGLMIVVPPLAAGALLLKAADSASSTATSRRSPPNIE
jgi:hypothetical protein